MTRPRCIVVEPDGYPEIAIAATYAEAADFARRRGSKWALGANAADIPHVVPPDICRRAVILTTDATATTAAAVTRAWPTFSAILVREDVPMAKPQPLKARA